jgi:hypothetical protein
MRDSALFRRSAAAIGLMTTAVLMVVFAALQPPFPDSFTDRLAAIDAAGVTGQLSAYAFALGQLPFIAGILGLSHLMRGRAPILSNLTATVGVIGAFGHSVFGGIAMVQLVMAADPANREVHATTLESLESSPAMAFAAMGLLGLIVGTILLAIGLARARVGPRWVPYALGAFLVVEFVGAGVAEWIVPLAGLLYFASFATLAVTVWRSPADAWSTGPAPRTYEPAPTSA